MKHSLSVTRRFRNIRRFQQILTVLARHGFGNLVGRLHLDGSVRAALRLVGRTQKTVDEEATGPLSTEARIRMICESLGPTFVKFGQLLATRPDLVPASLVEELSRLHDEVPPFPYSEVETLLDGELGDAWRDSFASVEPEPMAAASIAQVHSATLSDGRPVVLKVQRPGLDKLIDTDLDILRGLAELLEENVEELRPFRPQALVDEFARSICQEIDFCRELDNLQRFRRLFAETEKVQVPEPVPELSSRRVLTMERMDGFKVTDHAALEASGLDAAEIARTGTAVFLESIFEHGFFHADPHPGNFLVRPDGVLAVLDFGLMGRIDRRRIGDLLSLLVAILLDDPEMLVAQLQEMEVIGDSRDVGRLEMDVARILERYRTATLGDTDVAALLDEVFAALRGHEVALPTDLLLIGKTVATVEGIAKHICPTFQPLEEIRPFLISLYMRRTLDPREQSRIVTRALADGVALLRTLPRELRGLMRRLNRGELRVETVRADDKAERAQRDRAVNRLALTMILCTTMVLSTLLLYYPPGGDGTPWAAYIGLGVSFLLTVLLFWSFFRHKGL